MASKFMPVSSLIIGKLFYDHSYLILNYFASAETFKFSDFVFVHFS